MNEIGNEVALDLATRFRKSSAAEGYHISQTRSFENGFQKILVL